MLQSPGGERGEKSVKLQAMERRRQSFLVLAAAMAAAAVMAGPGWAGQQLSPSAVFTQTNTVPNFISIFHRNADGTLTAAGQVATGGAGKPVNNPPLALPYIQTTGEVALGGEGDDKHCLFAVNAGSNTVSSFTVNPSGIALADQQPSNGSRPVSLTSTQRGPNNLVLYVLNSDLNGTSIFDSTSGTASIQGYYVSQQCRLTPIPGSFHLTTTQASTPTAIAFNQQGTALSVVEPVTPAGGDIDIFPVDSSGVAGNPVVSPSAGTNPYGEAWDSHGHLTVTNWTFFSPPDGTVSSYRMTSDYKLVPISTVPAAGHPCWNVITKDDRFLYTTEPAGLVIGTPQILSYTIGHDGTLTPTGSGQTTPFNAVDEALSHDSRYLYVLNDGLLPFIPQSAISAFRIDQRTGQLTPIGQVDMPGNATSGLAAW
jgi:6-phosphogluconolactonase